jgi:colanic acid/amylovoran biosynthesis glycosyltransferase
MIDDTISVIQYCPTWLPQTQTWIYNQVKYLPNTVMDLIVCEQTENLDQFTIPNIHCHEHESVTGALWEKMLRNLNIRSSNTYLSALVKKFKTQLVHSHFGNIGWHNQKCLNTIQVKHIVTYYGFDVNMLPTQNPIWYKRYAELFEKADGFLCEGPFMANQLVRMGCPKNKITVQHLGVDVKRIQFVPRRFNGKSPLKILIAASFTEKKGIPYALEAIAHFRKNCDVIVTIIGDTNPKNKDNNEKNKILASIKKLELTDCTHLLGFQPYSKLFEEAYQNHIFISPSVTASTGDTEGGAPVSLIDMMATGMPVVSTKHCDIPEVVQYGETDWLTEERDFLGLSSRLEWLVNNPDNWYKMVSYGRAHIENEYDVEKQGVRLGKIYKALVLN